MPFVSVLVVSYRTPQLTAAAVRSALASTDVRDVVVVDNASGDSTEQRLTELDDERVSFVLRETNAGYGTAANEAAGRARSETLLLLNSDASVTSGAIAVLASEVDAHGRRCIVGPRLVGDDGSIQRSAGVLPRPSDLVVRAFGLHTTGAIPGLADLVRHLPMGREYTSAQTATETIDTTMVSGACFAIGRDAFWELGGFDERFFMYFEDADLCRRAAAAGIPIRYVPDAIVTHIGGASSSEDYHFGPLHARAMRQYLGKWYGPGGSALAILLLWLRAAGMTLALRPAARRAWRALWAALTDEDPRR